MPVRVFSRSLRSLIRSFGTFRACNASIYDPLGPRARASGSSRATLTLHKRSEAVARGAILALPSFDSTWFGRSTPDRQVVIVIVLAVIAVTALLVAGSAFLRGQRERARFSGEERLFTTTPLPMARDEQARFARESLPHDAFRSLRIPRWVQVGSLLVALVITWSVAQRVSPSSGLSVAAKKRTSTASSDLTEASPEDLNPAADEGPAFAFQARDWVTRRGGGCEGQLVVTRGEPSAWALTARVHDDEGQLIDTAHARVTMLRVGDVVEFNFPRADCDRIGAWDVRGDRQP
jgi:hypothetical protein